VTPWEAANDVLSRLDDYPSIGGESLWTRAEVEQYITDGFNAFTRMTKCIFDMAYPENLPPSGNYIADWELGYFESGMVRHSLLGYSGGYWEKDYALPGALGPMNHTQPWEATYLDTTFAVSVRDLPEDVVAVDRVTQNWHTMGPEFSRWFEKNDRSFQTVSGDPWRYSLDRDGIGRMRTVAAGDGQAETVTAVGTFGLLRYADDDEFGTWSPSGIWGCLREVPEHFPMNTPYGIPRRLFLETANTRVEFYRLGREIEEMPERWVKYVEFYAQAKCLERDGPGQDLKLSQHFMGRFNEGVDRMMKRLTEHRRAVSGKIGSAGRMPTQPALARLPWQYGRQIRRGY